MISKKAKAIYRTVELIKFKEKMNFDNPRRTKLNYIPLILNKNNTVEKVQICNRNVYKIVPKEVAGNKHIVFFHGGGYASESSVNHFLMINKFVDLCKQRVSFVEYPLTPEHTIHDTLEMVMETYKVLNEECPNDRFLLMGDSAGGGLALVVAMLIRDQIKAGASLKKPEKLILFSPWLDVTMTNPDILIYDEKDLFLNLNALEEVGKRYASDLPLDDFRVSPIYGDLTNLGEILLLYGSDEVFQPDCLKMSLMQDVVGTQIKGLAFESMQHDWVLFPIPEQEDALQVAVEFV